MPIEILIEMAKSKRYIVSNQTHHIERIAKVLKHVLSLPPKNSVKVKEFKLAFASRIQDYGNGHHKTILGFLLK